MPIYEYKCDTCGSISEFIVFGSEEGLACKSCKGTDLTKLMSAHNTKGSGDSGPMDFGAGMGGCCGSGPGSCGAPGGCCGM